MLPKAHEMGEHVCRSSRAAAEQLAPNGKRSRGHVLVADCHCGHMRPRDHLMACGEHLEGVQAAAHIPRRFAR
jgi:hypothetical protein